MKILVDRERFEVVSTRFCNDGALIGLRCVKGVSSARFGDTLQVVVGGAAHLNGMQESISVWVSLIAQQVKGLSFSPSVPLLIFSGELPSVARTRVLLSGLDLDNDGQQIRFVHLAGHNLEWKTLGNTGGGLVLEVTVTPLQAEGMPTGDLVVGLMGVGTLQIPCLMVRRK